MIKKTLTFLFLLFSGLISAQIPGEILNPLPGDTVIDGELIIMFRFEPGFRFNPKSIRVTVDRMNLNSMMKFRNNTVTVLLTDQIKPGTKKIKIKVKDEEGKIVAVSWNTEIAPRRELRNRGRDVELPVQPENLKVKADIETISRISDLGGDGSWLRQEPPNSHSVRFRGSIENQKFKIPVKLYLTNHEDAGLQTRNRFMTGFQMEKAGFSIGDINPSYNRLILPGTRIRGVEGYFRYRKTSLNIIYGTLNRAIEGNRLFYNSLTDHTLPPVNLEVIPDGNDSIAVLQGYYNTAGVFRRNVLAGKLSMGSPNTPNWFHIVFLKSSDDSTSIQYGGIPSQNFTFGLEVDYRSPDKKFHLYTGLSPAFTTKDIRRGVASRETIEAIYDIDLPVDPYKFRHLIIYNTTTNQVTFKHIPFLALYALPEYRFGATRINAEIRRIGTTYQSHGNPFLVNDRLTYGLNGRSFLAQKKLILSEQFRYQKNNLNRTNLVTYQTRLVNLSAEYRPKSKWPGISTGFRYFGRLASGGTVSADYHVYDYRAGLLWSGMLKQTELNSRVQFSRSLRQYPGLSNTFITNSLHLNAGMVILTKFQVNAGYELMLMSNDTSDYAKNNSFHLQLGYTPVNKKLKVFIRAGRMNSAETFYFTGAVRDFYELSLCYIILKNLEINLAAGNTIYNEDAPRNLDYNENWAEFGLRYSLKP